MIKLIPKRLILVTGAVFFILLQVNPGFTIPEDIPQAEPLEPAFLSADSGWVDSIMNKLSLEQRIAQMLMIQAYSNRDSKHLEELKELVKKHGVGGIIFFQGTPGNQARMTNALQQQSRVPLLIAMDAEWGLGMRLDNVISYPRQMVLGAIQDNELLYRMGEELADQLHELGVHMNFSPVADINNNPANPVINTRSFGENRENVATKSIALFKGMQDHGILVTAKHFPGHGDTNFDSHYSLPVLNFDRNRLDSIELYPFRHAVNQGVSGIMIAHLQIPELDNRPNRPTTLSEHVVTDLLKDELGFKGLAVTDAMNMRAVSDNFGEGESELEALKAGNDIILMPSDVGKVIHEIKRAVRRGEISEARIDSSCRKILLAKAWAGLDNLQKVRVKGLKERLNDPKYDPLRYDLVSNAITLLRNRNTVLPLDELEKRNIATLNLGVDGPTFFTNRIDLYQDASHFYLPLAEEIQGDSTLENQLRKFNTLIISTYYTRSYGNNYDIPAGVDSLLNNLAFDGDLILNFMGYPYALEVLGPIENIDAVMLSYTNDQINQEVSAEAVFGGIQLSGRLPVSVGSLYSEGDGIESEHASRLRYRPAGSAGMKNELSRRIDSIVNNALINKAMPGCQVLVARHGQVVLNRSYGYHTYRRRLPVKNTDIYDLASITKIASTIPSIMKLSDEGRFSVDSTLGVYFSGIDTSAKANLLIREVLTHQAGLKAWIPFYTSTLEPLDTSQNLFDTRFSYIYPIRIGPVAYANKNIIYKDSVYKSAYSEEYPVRVAEELYLRSEYRDTVYTHILQSPLGEKKYLYSDLGYYFLFRAVETITDTLFYPYNWYNFYGPLGAGTLGFLPLNRFSRNQIVPTENDIIFRRQLIHGDVHDPGAAMLGGIAGHAGLFSNANDLAKLMQMYLNYGTYGGKRFIDSATISEFTSCQFCEEENRRGLGFDRPMEEEDEGPACNSASMLSYGHSGFTGTLAWVDPDYDLVYVFLSNRIHPDQDNFKLITGNVRTEIQQVIYDSILE